MGESWFVVQTHPRAEEKANRHLINQNFATYLPRYRRPIRHARRDVVALRPLFPGYLFVHLDPDGCRWRSINGTIGVQRILADCDAPLHLPEQVIAEIKAREDENGVIKLQPTFSRGQAVRVLQGAMSDLDCLFEEMRDENRAILLVSLLGREVRMQVGAEKIAAA